MKQPDAYDRERDLVEVRGMDRDSASAVVSGEGNRPAEYDAAVKHFGYREIESGEDRIYARRAHPECEVCQEIFARGFSHAMHGWQPAPRWYPRSSNFASEGMIQPSAVSRVELEGYETYRRIRGINEE